MCGAKRDSCPRASIGKRARAPQRLRKKTEKLRKQLQHVFRAGRGPTDRDVMRWRCLPGALARRPEVRCPRKTTCRPVCRRRTRATVFALFFFFFLIFIPLWLSSRVSQTSFELLTSITSSKKSNLVQLRKESDLTLLELTPLFPEFYR